MIQNGGRRPLKGLTPLFLRYFRVVTLLPIILFLNLPKLLPFDIYMKACPWQQFVLCLRPSLLLAWWRSHASLAGWKGPDCRIARDYSAQSNQFHHSSISRMSDDYRIRFRMRVKWENVILKCVDLVLILRPNEHSPERPVWRGF